MIEVKVGDICHSEYDLLIRQDQGDLCRSPEVLFVTKIEFLGHFFPQEVL